MAVIYCAGEAAIQLFPRNPDARFGDALYFKKHIGGGAAVSAYSAASLGGLAAFVGNIAAGDSGGFIRYTLKAAGVDLSTAASRGDDSPIMLVKDLKNECRTRIFRAAGDIPPAAGEDLAKLKLSAGDFLHLAPQRSPAAGDLRAAVTGAAGKGCKLSLSLDGLWDKDPAVEALLRETGGAFSFVFLAEPAMEALKENFPNALALFLFKKDGTILRYPGAEKIPETVSHSIPPVSAANRQAVFAGAFLARLAAAGQEDEAARFAAAAAAMGAGHRSGLLPYPALPELERFLQGGAETATQREARLRLTAMAAQDYHRLKYHVMPEGGWMNDPNGLIQYRGKYHVFYQHNPYSADWGPMHWGHAASGDLVRWEHLPFALKPDQSYEAGCFSGSAVDNDGELTLIYTAHHDGRSPKETQCAAFSRDGVNFTKYENNPVIPGPPAGYGEDFRDPKAFRRGDLWYLVVGGAKNKRGCILLYSSKDLRRWGFRGRIAESDGTQGEMWECPDLFQLGDAFVLMCSPIGMGAAKTIFMTGDMDFDKPAFTQRAWQKVDYGVEFYAPQTFQDDQGRRILFGWMHTWGAEIPTSKKGWTGALTFPRELFLQDGEIWQRPVEEIETLRTQELWGGPLVLQDGQRNGLEAVRGDCLEIAFVIPAGRRTGKLSLSLREKAVLSCDFAARSFSLDKGPEGADSALIRLPPVETDGEIPVRILVDTSSVEVFLYGGKYAVSSRIFPLPSQTSYSALAEGLDLEIPEFRVWRLCDM